MSESSRASIPVLDGLPEPWEVHWTPPFTWQRPDLALLHPGDRLVFLNIRMWTDSEVPELIEEAEDHLSSWRPDENLRSKIGSEVIDDFMRLLVLWDRAKDHLGVRVNDDSNFNRVRATVQTGLALPRILELQSLEALRATLDKLAQRVPLGSLFRGIHLTDKGIHPLLGAEALASTSALLANLPRHEEDAPRLLDDTLSARFRSLLVLPDMETRRARPLTLDGEQRRLATTRTESGYRRVVGPAGSGKTLVLAARAAQLALDGKRVLVLTFNITLHRYIREMYERHCATLGVTAEATAKRAQFIHFHGYLKELAQSSPNTALAWRAVTSTEGTGPDTLAMVRIALAALNQFKAQGKPQVFDAVLVDEGQDWDPDWWPIVTESLAPGGECLLVSDLTQDLYGRSGSWTSEMLITKGFRGVPVGLERSYRLHPKLAVALADFVAEAFGAEGLPPVARQETLDLGLEPTLRWVITRPERLLQVAADEIAEAHRQIRAVDPLSTPDIFFSVGDHSAGTEVAVSLERMGHDVQDIFETDDFIINAQKKLEFGASLVSIKGTTVHSIKGWESRAIIAVFQYGDASAAVRSASLRRLYVAMSRLKSFAKGSLLTVVSDSDEWAKFFETRGFVIKRLDD